MVITSSCFIQLVSEGFTVPAASNLTQTVTLDNSIGRDTLLVFTYYDELDVYITTPNNNPLTILRDTDFKLISVRISNLVVSGLFVPNFLLKLRLDIEM